MAGTSESPRDYYFLFEFIDLYYLIKICKTGARHYNFNVH